MSPSPSHQQQPATADPSTPPSQSSAQLAVLLADALADLERAGTERDAARDRAQRAEHLLAAAAPPSSSSPSSAPSPADAITHLQNLNDTKERTISDLSQRLKVISDTWNAYDRWASAIDARSADARAAVGRAILGVLAAAPDSDIASLASPLAVRDLPAFQLPPISRKHSRPAPSAGLYPPHAPLSIPPGAPGSRVANQLSGVPANFPPVPGNVLAGRVRPREPSVSRRRSDDEPGTADSAAPDDRPHRLSQDDADSVVDLHTDGERNRKRQRIDGPTSSSTTAASTSAGPPRRNRFSDSPGSSNAQFSQFTFPHNQPHYPPQPGSGSQPSPRAPYSYPPHQLDSRAPRGSESAPALPGPLQISDRAYAPRPTGENGAPMTRHPRTGSESTLASAITPTSAATTMSGRSAGSQHPHSATKETGVLPYHARHSRSGGGDARADSLGDATSIMGGLKVVDSPRQMHHILPRRFTDRTTSYPQPIEEDARGGGDDRRRAQSTRDEEGMDVDRASTIAKRRSGDGEPEDKNSVDELLLSAVIGDEEDRDADGEERDELPDDRDMSPMSVQQPRGRRPSDAQLEQERWKARDRQLERERGMRPDETGSEPSSAQHLTYQNANGLVKVKEDRFRHYYKQSGFSPTSPVQSTAKSPLPMHHGASYPPPTTATYSMQHGQLQPTGRRGTIAGLITTTTPREDYFQPPSRASYSGPGHVRRPSDGPPSSSMSHPSIVSPGGVPQSAQSILFPHAQPRHTGPGPAVKPTLNAQGQRTCRQCHQPGRYKDGKCVEKWGPGPAGPGTVCDRCRKKMKRVERRGTQDAATLGQHIPLVPLAQQQQRAPAYPSPGQQPYARDGGGGPVYSPHEQPAQREYHFQTPLSASSNWGARGSGGGRNSVVVSPTSASGGPGLLAKQQQQLREIAASKPKRKTPTYSESPSPPPRGIEEDEAGVPSQARSASNPSRGASSNHDEIASRKGSSSAEMESAAEVLMADLTAASGSGRGDSQAATTTTTLKDNRDGGDDDAEGEGEEEEEEEDEEEEEGAAAGEGDDMDAVGEEEDDEIDVDDSGPTELASDEQLLPPRSKNPTVAATTTTSSTGRPVVNKATTGAKDSNAKQPGWVKLEETASS